jgi:hypothetical protein
VTHFSNTLGEAVHEEKTRVAGMVTGIRPHQTKTGKMMGWVTLEDLTGVIELVLFPRTWEKFQFALEISGVIVVEGKVDAQSSPPKVLVDNIRTQIKLTDPAQIPLQPQRTTSDPSTGSGRGRKPAPVKPAAQSPKRVAESRPVYHPASPPVGGTGGGSAEDWENGAPPLPENPPEWDSYTPAAATFAVPDLVTHEADLPEETVTSNQYSVNSEPSSAGSVAPTAVQSSIVHRPPSVEPIAPKLNPLPPAALPADDHAPQMVTVTLRPSGDPERDIRRITRLHGTFISYPGRDRFAFQVFEDGRGHLVEFPNDTTRVCAELMAKIKDTVGEENVRVEPITYQ